MKELRLLTTRHAMTWGLLLGLVFSTNFYFSSQNSLIASVLSWVLIVAIPMLVYRFTKDCNVRIHNGSMKFSAALWYGFMLFFYASIVSAAFKMFYFKVLAPDFLQNLTEQTTALMQQLDMPISEAEMKEVKHQLTPIQMSISFVWVDVVVGFFVSLVTAAIVAKKNKAAKQPD